MALSTANYISMFALVRTMLCHLRPFLLFPLLAIGCAKNPNFPELKGHVVDRAGNPVPGAIVKLVPIKFESDPNVATPIDYAETDGNGDFDFSETDLRFGRGNGKGFKIVVSKRGYEAGEQDVFIADGPKKRDAIALNESAK